MPKFVNPYQARTPLGQSLNAVATALFSGPNARELDAIEADAEQKRLHGLLYGEQTRKARFEADAQEQANRMRSPESMTESAALLHGVPTSNVQGLIDYSGGRVAMPPAMPGGIDPRMVAETLFAQRAGAGDKTSSATEVATARSRLGMDRNREDVISGRLSPTVSAQAMYPEKGHAPFTQNAQGSMLNVVEGRQDQSSPLAVASIGSENAQAVQRRAAAGASSAHAGLFRSQTQGQDITNRTGVTAGAPVIAINPDTGVEGYTSPRVAVVGERAPGAKPLTPEAAELAAARAEAARAKAGGKTDVSSAAAYAEALADRLEGYLTENPRSTTGPVSGIVRSFEALSNAAAPGSIGSQGTLAAQTKESLLTAMGAMKKEGMGKMSNQDMQRIDRALGAISSGTPDGMRQGLNDVRDTVDVLRGRQPRSLAGGGTTPVVGTPPVAGARKSPRDGQWYVPDPNRPGKYLKVNP